MSLEQLERQIQIATLAMEKATQTGDKKLKGDIREELENFKMVLEKSKARLKELETMKRNCSELSDRKSKRMEELQAAEMRVVDKGRSMKGQEEEALYIKPVAWLQAKATDKDSVPSHYDRVVQPPSTRPPSTTHPYPRAQPPVRPEESPTTRQAPPAGREDRNDMEEGGLLQMAMSFGNQIFTSATDMASVSSLGSQVFGTSEITKAVTKELIKREEIRLRRQEAQAQYRPRIQDALRRNNEATLRMQSDEIRDQPLEVIPSFTGTFSGQGGSGGGDPSGREGAPEIVPSFTGTGTNSGTAAAIMQSFSGTGAAIMQSFTGTDTGASGRAVAPDKTKASPKGKAPESNAETNKHVPVTAEHIAEQELLAREKYIVATRKHQELRRTGLLEDSPEMQKSAKYCRDCYAQIEYWECLGEECSNDSGSNHSGLRSTAFHGRDPRTTQPLDVDKETAKARDAYAYAMARHQALVRQRVCTSSTMWKESQDRVNESLANLQYWEGRSAFAVPPSI